MNAISPARLNTYRQACAEQLGVDGDQIALDRVASMYVWQSALGAAWFENLAYVEPIIRNSVDLALREMNRNFGESEDWLRAPYGHLESKVKKAADAAKRRANIASKARGTGHPRRGQSVNLDDLVAQLTFGNLARLFPKELSKSRSQNKSNRTAEEHLWIDGLKEAFPHVGDLDLDEWGGHPPPLSEELRQCHAVGRALDRILRLRNRVAHHEQILRVNHWRRRTDVIQLLNAIDSDAAAGFIIIDQIPRILAMKPV